MFIHNDLRNRPGDPGTHLKTGLGNQYGDLEVCLVEGVPHICITCEVNRDKWRPCSQALYDAIREAMKPGGELLFSNDDKSWDYVDLI